MTTLYTDPLGRLAPPPAPDGTTRHYLGNLPKRGVVHWDTTPRTMKIVRQYDGSTLVSLPKPPRSFTPKVGPSAGEVVFIPGGRETVAVARGTIVWRTP